KDSRRWQDYETSLFICEADTGRILHRVHEEAGAISEPRFSPDGKLLAAERGGGGKFNRPRQLAVWEADTAKEVRTIYDVYGWAWSPDGKTLAGAKRDFDNAYLWDVATGKELHRLPVHHPPGTDLAFSPDGKTLAVGNYGAFSLPEGKKPNPVVH